MPTVKAKVSTHIRAVFPGHSMFAHTIKEIRGSFRRRAGYLAPLDGWGDLFDGTLIPFLMTVKIVDIGT